MLIEKNKIISSFIINYLRKFYNSESLYYSRIVNEYNKEVRELYDSRISVDGVQLRKKDNEIFEEFMLKNYFENISKEELEKLEVLHQKK